MERQLLRRNMYTYVPICARGDSKVPFDIPIHLQQQGDFLATAPSSAARRLHVLAARAAVNDPGLRPTQQDGHDTPQQRAPLDRPLRPTVPQRSRRSHGQLVRSWRPNVPHQQLERPMSGRL